MTINTHFNDHHMLASVYKQRPSNRSALQSSSPGDHTRLPSQKCVLLFGLSVVRFVRTPEVLERFVTIERETSQLENSLKSFKASNADGETQANTKHSWKLPGLFAPAKALPIYVILMIIM